MSDKTMPDKKNMAAKPKPTVPPKEEVKASAPKGDKTASVQKGPKPTR